jgi:hypothetical protein
LSLPDLFLDFLKKNLRSYWLCWFGDIDYKYPMLYCLIK